MVWRWKGHGGEGDSAGMGETVQTRDGTGVGDGSDSVGQTVGERAGDGTSETAQVRRQR